MTALHVSSVPEYERYEVNAITGCWLWLGYVNKDGYGRLNSENAHRLFYIKHVGPVEDGHDVDHLCKNRRCVNPSHLEAIPEAENLRRITRAVTYLGRGFDICREGHPMEGYNVLVNAQGKRTCRTCNNARARARKAAANPRGAYGLRAVSS